MDVELGSQSIEVDKSVAGVNMAALISDICNTLGVSHFLSYGYGSSYLFTNIKVDHQMKLQKFDPDVDNDPVPAEFVACVDVLGWDDTDTVMNDLVRLTDACVFANIRTSDDHPVEWWVTEFCKHFDIHTVQVVTQDEFFIIAYAKALIEDADGSKAGPGKRLANPVS